MQLGHGACRTAMRRSRPWLHCARPTPACQKRFIADNGTSHDDAVRAMAADAASNIEKGADELVNTYGQGQNNGAAVLLWMTDYYKHQQHKYFVPALSLLVDDERQMQIPSLAVKNAIFFSSVLRDLPTDAAAHYCAALTLVPGLPMDVLLAIVHGAGMPVTKAVFDRLGASIRRSGQSELIRAAQHVASVPHQGTPQGTPTQWTAPWLMPQEHLAGQAWRDGPVGGGTVYPWELLPSLPRFRDPSVPLHDWLLLSSTTHLEAQWAAFYASGSRHALQGVIQAALPWHEFAADLPDAVQLITDVKKPLPDSIVGAGKAAGAPVQDVVRAVKAHTSRAALWSLLTFSRRHSRVTDAVVQACHPLSTWMLDEDVRAAEEAAQATGTAAAAQPAGAERVERIDEAQAKARMEVLPSLLHLMASLRSSAT